MNVNQTRDSSFNQVIYSFPSIVIAVTTHAPSKGFFFCSNLRFGERQSTFTMVFTRWPTEYFFSVSQALGGKCRRLSRFLQNFATGSDTASCQDYQEYEFVECLSKKTQIFDLFKHCKLQPH